MIRAAVTLLLLAAAGGMRGVSSDPIPWHKDLEAARKLAAAEGKPLLLVFR